MSKKANPVLIGIFTLAGLVLAGGALVLFGAGKFFEKTSIIMLYFDKSANGLLVGSEVRFGGVRIGRVTSIKVLIDPKQNRKIIPVTVELSEKELADVGSTSGDSLDLRSDAGVQKAVAEGLRARMKQQSLLTGQLYIEFDIVPSTPAITSFTYQPEPKPPWPSVPTVATEMDELISGVADGLKKFNALDLGSVTTELRDLISATKGQVAALKMKEINENLVGITADVKNLTGNEKLAKAIESLDEALTAVRDLARKSNEKFEPLVRNLEKVMTQTSAGLAKISEASTGLSEASNPHAPVLMRLQNAMDEIARAARAITDLANDLKRNPNTILMGKDSKP